MSDRASDLLTKLIDAEASKPELYEDLQKNGAKVATSITLAWRTDTISLARDLLKAVLDEADVIRGAKLEGK